MTLKVCVAGCPASSLAVTVIVTRRIIRRNRVQRQCATAISNSRSNKVRITRYRRVAQAIILWVAEKIS